VTNRTRDRAVEVVRERIVLAGLDGNTTVAAAGDSRLRVRTTASVGRVRSLVAEGRVDAVVTVPADGRPRNVTVVDETGFDNVGEAQPGRASQPPRVPVTMSDSAAANFSESMRTLGFTSDEGIGGCRYEEPPAEPGYCLQTVVDGEVVYAASMSAGLADLLRSGEFQEDPEFVLTAQNVSRAEELSLTLRSGSLPGPTRVVGTATVTPSVTPTDERSAATGGNDGGPTTGDGPAPGPVLSLAAVVAAGLAWGRRQSDS
jgi:preprotein translocase subunit SecD